MFNFLKFIIITVSTKRKMIDKFKSDLINKHIQYDLQLYKKLNKTEFTHNKQECISKEKKVYNDEDLLETNQDLNDFSSLLENEIEEDTNLNENLLSDILDNEEINDQNIRALYSDNKSKLSSDHSEEYLEIEKEYQNLIELPKIEIKEKESFLIDLPVESNIDFFENNIYNNFDISKISYDFGIISDSFNIKEYFDWYLKNIPEKNEILDSLKIINSKMLSSFFKKTQLKNQTINEIKDFKSYIFKLSCKLEQRFAFRLDHKTRQTSKNIANILQDIFIFVNDEKILEEFNNFYQRYILNSFIQNYFENTQIASSLHPNFEINMILLLNKFNSFYLEYSKSVEQIYDTVFKNYSNKILKHFYFKDHDLIKKTLQIYITDLLYNKTNSILLILFSELKFLIEKTINSHKINILYTKIHFFFSLLVCKLNFNLLNLKYEFDNSKYLNEFLITDSKFINLFVLEMRLFVCVSCLTLLDNLKEIKLIFLKAFASFIRCFDHNFLNYFLFNEFSLFDYLKGVDNHIRIHSNAYEHGLKATKKGFKKVPDFDIQFISTSLISADFLGLNEMERVEKLILLMESRVEDRPKILRMNIGFVQRITEFLFEYFRELD